jgi:hypothetical protein
VRPIRDSLVAHGLEIFWDQEVPPGKDWDEWIRRELDRTRAVVVFWSKSSVRSKSVRHEAAVGEQQGKLVPVLLDPLTAEEFPMGFYTAQAIDFTSADGSEGEWAKLLGAVEEKVVSAFALRRLKAKDAELKAAIRRAELAEAHQKVLEGNYENALKSEHEAKLSARRVFSELEGLIDQLHARLKEHEASRITAQNTKHEVKADVKSSTGQPKGDPLWFLAGRPALKTAHAADVATRDANRAPREASSSESLDQILATIRKSLAEEKGP